MSNFAVGYCRLSDRNERSQSITSQKKDITEYCLRNKLTLLEIFVDDGKSGWTFDRPGFKQLEVFCKKQSNVQYLIIPHFDRFSRADPIDAMVKERYFRDKLGVKVLQVSESLNVDTSDSTYQMIRFMQAFTANQERRRIVERTTKGMRYRIMQGRYSGTAPFGYKNVRDDKGQAIIVVDPDRAPIIKYIYDSYLKGASFAQIKTDAAKKGFTVKGHCVIQKVLCSPVYAGMLQVRAYEDQPEKIIPAVHDAIISKEKYWQVQQLMNPRRFTPQKRDEVPLRGVLRCRICGKLLTAAPSKSRSGKYYWYYFCTTDRKENYSAITVHKNLDLVLDALSLKGEVFQQLKEKLSASIEQMINTQTRELMKINLAIESLSKSIALIEEKYLLEAVSPESYKKVSGEKKTALFELTVKKDSLSLSANDYLGRLDTVMKKAATIRTIYNEMNLLGKQQFIKRIFGNLFFYAPNGFRTTFLLPVFTFNKNALNDLPIIIESDSNEKAPKSAPVTPWGTLTNLTWEDVLLFFELFAA